MLDIGSLNGSRKRALSEPTPMAPAGRDGAVAGYQRGHQVSNVGPAAVLTPDAGLTLLRMGLRLEARNSAEWFAASAAGGEGLQVGVAPRVAGQDRRQGGKCTVGPPPLKGSAYGSCETFPPRVERIP